MHFTTAVVAAAAAVAPLVNAHGGAAIPQIVGLNVKDLKARDLLANLRARVAQVTHAEQRAPAQPLEARQNTNGQCGPGIGSCAAGVCCSADGVCGTTSNECYSPGCQWQYGPGCSENKTPAGASTASVARTKFGNVPYGGAGIYSCTKPGTVALTFDDGPLQGNTAHVLDLFKSYNAKGTFFITGSNLAKGQIDITPELTAVIQRMYNEGHQIGSHTWTHLDLSKISAAERTNQMIKNEMALRNILGFFPTYMRPPYSSCDAPSGCEQAMADLGYHVSYFNVDTDDYEQDSPTLIQNSKNWFKGNITAGGATAANNDWLSIAHDIHQQTAYNLTEYMLSTITQLGYKAVPIGECLNDPVGNWYRGGNNTTTPPGQPISSDGSCAGTNGYTCQGSAFGNCCSQYGFCGSTDGYCGAGCQTAFGTCSGGTTNPGPTISPDATCGGTKGYTCQGSAFGNCCSQNGWCGSTTDYCGTGCNKNFGTCT